MTNTAAVAARITSTNIMNTSTFTTMTSTAAVAARIPNTNIMHTNTITTITSTAAVAAGITSMSTMVTPTMLSPQSVSTFWRTSAALTVLPKWRNGSRLLKASKALPLLLQQNSFA